MKKTATLFTFALFASATLAQLNKSGNEITIQPEITPNQSYLYQLNLTKINFEGDKQINEVDFKTPVKITLYSEGDGFNLFEWESQPMLFFKTNENNASYNFSTNNVSVKYRTDENYVMGEVSNYDEVIQDYTLAYQKLYQDNETNFNDLAAKSSLYFIQMFHLFFGQEFNMNQKEKMMNLFYNPMKNTFSAAEDEITYTETDNKPNFKFVQKYNTDMEDNSAKMMNHKTVDSYRNRQADADYKMKSWGNQSFQSNGLIDKIERIVEVKQDGKITHFIYSLTAI